MKTMKVKKFVGWVKENAAKVLSLSVSYYDETVAWMPCGVIVSDRWGGVKEFHPYGTLEEALNRIKGGKACVVFSNIGEVRLRLRP